MIMIKSIQWKLVIMFVLLVISVIIVVGTFLLYSVTNFYHRDFINQMDNILGNKDFLPIDVTVDNLSNKLKVYIGQLGIDSYRNYYILNELGGVLKSSKEITSNLESSANIISAINGKIGRQYNSGVVYVDYALPVLEEGSSGNVKYIIYIQDTKEELKEVTSSINKNIFLALAFGLMISVVLGFLLSNTITTPIMILTQKAEKIAYGDFDYIIEAKSKDEIGKLTNAFNFMAKELKMNLDKIDGEKNKMEAILRHMTDGVMAFNLKGDIIHVNPEAKKMLSIEQEDNINFNEYFKQLDVPISLGDLIYLDRWDALERQFIVNELHLKAFFVAFQIEKDKAGGIIVVLQDITEQQKLEQIRREFVANVSHELRTPLTSIKSYAETLLEGAIDDKETAMHFLQVINNESERMTRLVRDLLVLSRLDYKQVEWKKTYFALGKLIEEVVEKLSLIAKNQDQSLNLTFTTELPKIYADRDRVEQVLTNIVSNAIKYTPQGGVISVFTGCIYSEIYIKVIDNGVGIPKADLSRIFERFYRVDKARSRELGGTGLGLAIAKEIITAHDGDIIINSEQGMGTEVIIKLPYSQDNVNLS